MRKEWRAGGGAGTAESNKWHRHRRALVRPGLCLVRGNASDPGASRKNNWRIGPAISRRIIPELPGFGPAYEKLAARNVVRSNRTALGDAIAKYTYARH